MAAWSGLRQWWRRSRPGGFWRRVTEGLTLSELWTQFRKETTASYRVYAKAVDGAPATDDGSQRWQDTSRTLFWALLAKLSPARRVFLLVTLVVLVWGVATTDLGRTLLAALLLLVLLALELADRVAMKRDLEIARDIQGWLLPKQPPQVAGADIAFTTRPANTVAGDYYDAFLRDGEAAGERPPLLVVVADVAGKSMPAALLMATFQASLRTVALEGTALPELVRRINRYACAHSLEGRRFTTAVFLELDLAGGVLRYVNAGHNAPLLRRPDGSLLRLEAGGLPLGIQPDLAYEAQAVRAAPGDLLVVYTDGIVEAENERREEYGEARLADLVGGPAPASAAEGLERVLSSIGAFTGAAPQLDDITCVVVRCTES